VGARWSAIKQMRKLTYCCHDRPLKDRRRRRAQRGAGGGNVLERLLSIEFDLLSRSTKRTNLVDNGNQRILSESIVNWLSRLIHAIACFTSHLALVFCLLALLLFYAHSQITDCFEPVADNRYAALARMSATNGLIRTVSGRI
jgi:hypothetical protein